ncbi:MAG: ABC transporter substrate-binding protein, partial [Angelakisella sp.]
MLAALVLLPLGGCQKKQYEISIAEQFGIAYAPLAIMKEKKLLEEKLPGITVNWKQFGGPTAIREGMLSGDIDIGFMGCAPVL